MTSLTSFCEMTCQIVQKKLEEKRIEEEQAATAQNRKLPVCYDDDDDKEESNSLKDNNIFLRVLQSHQVGLYVVGMERGFLSQRGGGGRRGRRKRKKNTYWIVLTWCRSNVGSDDESFHVLNTPGNSSGGSVEVVKDGMDLVLWIQMCWSLEI
nr:hypothetical protein [Tanacetum cinerariifolium]